MAKARGMLVAVLGPDGAGKTTLAWNLVACASGPFRSAQYQHVRPRLFGRRDEPNPRPHAQPAYGGAKSFLKLAYLIADYLLGYLARTRPALRRQGLCVSDRYFHDLLVDPRRYRYGLPLWIARCALPLVPRPDLLLVLHAPIAVIRGRKGELGPRECARQLIAYRALAYTYPYVRLLDASAPPELVAARAHQLILECMAERDRTAAPANAPMSAGGSSG